MLTFFAQGWTWAMVGDMAFNGMLGTVGAVFALGGLPWRNPRDLLFALITPFILVAMIHALLTWLFGLGETPPPVQAGFAFFLGFVSRPGLTWARTHLFPTVLTKATGGAVTPEVLGTALTTTTLPPASK